MDTQNLQIPPKDNLLTPEALYTLRRKLAETNKLHAALVAEKNRNEAQITRLRALLTPPKQAPRSSTSSEQQDTENTNAQDAAPFAFLTHAPAAQALGVQALSLIHI